MGGIRGSDSLENGNFSLVVNRPTAASPEVSGASGTLQFLYNGDALVGEYDGPQTRPRVYVHGVGEDVPLVWYEYGAGGRRIYADHQGSIVAIAHPLGAYVAINGYDEYGIPNAGNQGRFGYTGQIWLPELGMYYYKARIYSPTLGRFLQTDPIGYAGGMNLYQYVGGDPVNGVDPFGLQDIFVNCPVKVNGNCTSKGLGELFWDSIVGSNAEPEKGDPVPYREPPREKKLSACMKRFLTSQGYGARNLDLVTFREGDGGNSKARIAFGRNHPAITLRNDIYVRGDYWDRKSTPRGGDPTFFEEILHSIQWDVSGGANFIMSYLTGAAGAGLLAGDMHDNPAELQAIGLSRRLMQAYRTSGMKCPD